MSNQSSSFTSPALKSIDAPFEGGLPTKLLDEFYPLGKIRRTMESTIDSKRLIPRAMQIEVRRKNKAPSVSSDRHDDAVKQSSSKTRSTPAQQGKPNLEAKPNQSSLTPSQQSGSQALDTKKALGDHQSHGTSRSSVHQSLMQKEDKLNELYRPASWDSLIVVQEAKTKATQ